tara:strand:+ start:447 stop:662 length:216 start_codon:yes stop_codon:yes gene_type:complete
MKVRLLVDCIIGNKHYFRDSIYALDDELALELINMEPPSACILVCKAGGGPPTNKMYSYSFKNKEQTNEVS